MNETPTNPGTQPTHPNIIRSSLAIGTATSVAGHPAGFWRRASAVTIDSIILGVVLFPVSILVIFVYQAASGQKFIGAVGREAIVMNLIINGITLLIKLVAIYFYYGYFYSTRGASPGKQLMGLKVVDSDKGTYLSYNDAFLREVIGKYIFDTFTLGIGYLMVAFRADKKALHDIAFSTQVIHQPK